MIAQYKTLEGNFISPWYQSILNDTEVTKVAGPSGPRISTGPAGRSLFSLTGPTVNILATGQRASDYVHPWLVYCTLKYKSNILMKTKLAAIYL